MWYVSDGWHVFSKFIRPPVYQVIHGGYVCCRSLRRIPLKSVQLLENWCVHEQGTFAWAFQSTRGQQGLLGCCGIAAEKGKCLLPLSQNSQVGITSAQDAPALLSLQGESLGCLVPLSATCPGTVYVWDCVVLARVWCPALLEWEGSWCCVSSNTCGTWWDVVCAKILIDT